LFHTPKWLKSVSITSVLTEVRVLTSFKNQELVDVIKTLHMDKGQV